MESLMYSASNWNCYFCKCEKYSFGCKCTSMGSACMPIKEHTISKLLGEPH